MCNMRFIGVVLVAGCLGVSARASDWNESSAGDLSTDPNNPTAIAFGLGSNTITGSVLGGTDTRDYITFTINPGFQLNHLMLLSYRDENGDLGNTGYNAINAGATSFIPSSGTANSFLGGAHVETAMEGTDLLSILSDPLQRQNGTGLTVPVPAGTYSYLIQQTSTGVTSAYGLDFQVGVTPEPTTLSALGLLGLSALRRR